MTGVPHDDATIAARYSRQMRFAPWGSAAQDQLQRGRAVLCGCGALGTAIAESLVRAGVGHLRIIDRDFVELSNLHRQVLFDEDDVAAQLPKAIAATQKLARINSSVTIEPIVADLDARHALSLLRGFDLILDATDNFETRFLINDAALELQTPWIYGGCIGSHGQSMTVIPGETACLRCLIESPPEPGTTETCDTAGVIGPAVQVIAALQSVAALKLLSGQRQAIAPQLTIVDVWEGSWRTVSLADLRERSQCPACVQGERRWLRGEATSRTTVLCGRNAIQLTPATAARLDLAQLSQQWSSLGTVAGNSYLLRLHPTGSDIELTVFEDGRAIIKGTDNPATARTLYARYIGS